MLWVAAIVIKSMRPVPITRVHKVSNALVLKSEELLHIRPSDGPSNFGKVQRLHGLKRIGSHRIVHYAVVPISKTLLFGKSLLPIGAVRAPHIRHPPFIVFYDRKKDSLQP